MTWCASEPIVPELMTGGNIGEYIILLRSAQQDCEKTLRELVEWLRNMKQIEEGN